MQFRMRVRADYSGRENVVGVGIGPRALGRACARAGARARADLVQRACKARGIEYSPDIVKGHEPRGVLSVPAIFNAVDALARGKPIEQAVTGQ